MSLQRSVSNPVSGRHLHHPNPGSQTHGTAGDADGIGHVRKREILTSARLLGLRADADVLVHEDPAFPDSIQKPWDADAIAAVLASLFSKQPTRDGARKQIDAAAVKRAWAGVDERPLASIDAVITFDRQGVSGHLNHYSLYYGAVAWLKSLMRGKSGWECPVALYALTSTGMARKYLALLDAPLTLLLCVRDTVRGAGKKGEREAPRRLMFMSDVLQWRRAQQAMTAAHESQMRWFRWGWIVASRYMVVNDLKRVKV